MSFYQTIRSGLLALFQVSTAEGPSTRDPELTIEDIRATMLEMAGKPSETTVGLVRRIRYAADPQALWFIRSELMGLLARKEGEAVARAKIELVSDLFRELLPRGLRSRPSPLVGSREERQDRLRR
jgi:hypothetical protein